LVATERIVLAVDVGGSHVKLLSSGETESRRFDSGPGLTPRELVDGVQSLAADWTWDVVSVGIPTPVYGGKVIAEPINLGDGWVGFDYEGAFGKPTKVINDAAMQAIGSYEGGRMLFLGIGTGLGSTLIVEGVVEPLELGHLPYRKSTFEEYVSESARERRGKKKCRAARSDAFRPSNRSHARAVSSSSCAPSSARSGRRPTAPTSSAPWRAATSSSAVTAVSSGRSRRRRSGRKARCSSSDRGSKCAARPEPVRYRTLTASLSRLPVPSVAYR
jgi:hypothetical protein